MVGWPSCRFLELVGTEQPIIQAPMAGAGGVELCIAAMKGGALGSLPCAMLSPDEVRRQVGAVRAQSSLPFALNFFCHVMPRRVDEHRWRMLLQPYYDEFRVQPANGGALRLPFDHEMCLVVEELRPAVVSFHFGLPDERLLDQVKASGSIIIGNATTLEEAEWLTERGVDALVAQGFEAGGHVGRFLGSDPAEALGLFALLPQIVDRVGLPVIAAGAVADGRAIAAAFMLGASAVQLGTAYLHTPQAQISIAHRNCLLEGRTLFTNLMTGGLARGLHGRLVDELGPVRSEAPPYPLAGAALTPIRTAAEQQSEFGFGPMWAGQGAPLGKPEDATGLTRRLASEALALLSPQG